jgi:hypothetical protein
MTVDDEGSVEACQVLPLGNVFRVNDQRREFSPNTVQREEAMRKPFVVYVFAAVAIWMGLVIFTY